MEVSFESTISPSPSLMTYTPTRSRSLPRQLKARFYHFMHSGFLPTGLEQRGDHGKLRHPLLLKSCSAVVENARMAKKHKENTEGI